MKINRYILLLFVFGSLILSVIFLRNGILNVYPDTPVYVEQIKYYNNDTKSSWSMNYRSYKPFYGFTGSLTTPPLTEHQSLLLINVVFFFGLLFSSFYFLKELELGETYSLIGALWIGTGYPLLKYGLALLTDISGWFFAIATITIFLIGIRKSSKSLLLLASTVGFLGSLCKETGVLGLLFSGLFLVFSWLKKKDSQYLKKIFYISVPFIILQSIFLSILLHKGGSSFLTWFKFNNETVTGLRTPYLFFFTELSTFHILWLYSVVGFYLLVKSKVRTLSSQGILLLSLFISTLPIFAWPAFLNRILYIQYLFVVPFSLFTVKYVYEKTKNKSILYSTVLLPIIISLFLFLLAGNGSLFDTLKSFI